MCILFILKYILIFLKISLKLSSQLNVFTDVRGRTKVFPSGSSAAALERYSVGWFVYVCTLSSHNTLCWYFIAVYILLYTYTSECVSEPLMRTPADGISDKWCTRHVRRRIKHCQQLLLIYPGRFYKIR